MLTDDSHRLRAQSDRGAVYVFAVVLMAVLLLAAGLVVDLGQQRFARRDAQANADVIALDMAQLADGATLAKIKATPMDPNGIAANHLEASVRRNNMAFAGQAKEGTRKGSMVLKDANDEVIVEVHFGWFSEAQETNECGVQTQSGSGWWAMCDHGSGAQVPNAAMVVVHDQVDYLFLSDGVGNGKVNRAAIARYGGHDLAGFQLSSYLVDGGPALSTLLGSPANFTVLSNAGIARTDLTLGDLAAELGAGTVEELVDTEVTYGQLVQAVATAVGAGDSAKTQLILDQFATSKLAVNQAVVRVGDLISVASPGGSAALNSRIDFPDLIAGAAALARCNPDVGSNFGHPDCNAIVSGFNVGHGLGLATLKVIETPRVRYGVNGDSAITSQLQLQLGVQNRNNGNLLNLLEIVVTPTLRAARATGTIRDLCVDPAVPSFGLGATQAAVEIDLLTTVKLAGLPIGHGLIRLDVASDPPPSILGPFTESNLGTPYPFGGSTLSVPTVDAAKINVLNLPALRVAGTVSLLNGLIGSLNTSLGPALNQLGVRVAGGTATPLAVRCGDYGVQLVG